ncbi:RNA polymerase sigma factor SigJ [Oleiagrimonas sp. C23AA]|uniref:RNA polymerase sigma factor SigJ n=1 Tax=Oleiagrimonas sp. C23AA TaxID=2719047 RepID=UPI00141F96CA|nr:RNA polymerase sigma factor SigJ [Oleiagrimonas sp. C23AA]NII11810.1 RNA polymerase sigma factor SigJ [Oleiagrimonas sp. C23AA]
MHTDTSLFQSHRPRLFGLAYRMLGSRQAAEDVVQDCWLRWHQADLANINAPEAWLVTVVTRLALDQLRRERRERERYVGPWLPEPLPTPEPPDADVERAQHLSIALLHLLERLTPRERAAFLLHEVFDHDYAELATILDQSQATSRQQVRRARQHIHGARGRDVDPATHRRMLSRLAQAMAHPEPETLRALLADDVTLVSDGGGRVRAALRPLHGAERLIRLYRQLATRSASQKPIITRMMTLNAEPALVQHYAGRIHSVTWIVTDGRRIQAIHTLRNPDKLVALQADVTSHADATSLH